MKYSELKTKKARIEFLKEKLRNQPTWALKGLVRIYEFQTADEQASRSTNKFNKVGFTGVDADILSSFAEQFQKRGFLTPRQMKILFKKMPKYARQLDAVAQGTQS